MTLTRREHGLHRIYPFSLRSMLLDEPSEALRAEPKLSEGRYDHDLFKAYPFNLTAMIFDNPADALSISVKGLDEAMESLISEDRACIDAWAMLGMNISEIVKEHSMDRPDVETSLKRGFEALKQPDKLAMIQPFKNTKHNTPSEDFIPWAERLCWLHINDLESLHLHSLVYSVMESNGFTSIRDIAGLSLDELNDLECVTAGRLVKLVATLNSFDISPVCNDRLLIAKLNQTGSARGCKVIYKHTEQELAGMARPRI